MTLTPRVRPPILMALLLGSLVIVACADQRAPTAPSASLPVPQPDPVPPPAPVPPPTRVQPVVTAITPNAGTTAGGSWGTITGGDFLSGARVRLGNNVLRQVWVRDSTTLMFWADPHSAGTVDVTVTNPGGLEAVLSGGFTYAPAGSFDADGDWLAHAGPDFETDMHITIQSGALLSFSCGTSAIVTPSSPTPVRSGELSYVGEDGVSLLFTIVSPANAIGTIDMPGCHAARWWAERP